MATPPRLETPGAPLSLTSLPSPAAPRPPIVKPPVLASDILRDEVAPMTPARRGIRVALFTFGAVFTLAAAAARGAPELGVGPWVDRSALAPSAAAACAAILLVALPLSYAARAALAALLGAAPLVLAVLGRGALGPLRALDGSVAATAATLPLFTVLPAALLFRARYRAYRGARAALAIALLLAAPAVVLFVLTIADASLPLGDRVTAGLATVATATALFGFMGPETPAACAQWAGLVLGAAAARPALHATLAAWEGDVPRMSGFAVAAAGALLSGTLVMLAVFQLLAAATARRAREVDVHQIVGAGAASRPSLPPSPESLPDALSGAASGSGSSAMPARLAAPAARGALPTSEGRVPSVPPSSRSDHDLGA